MTTRQYVDVLAGAIDRVIDAKIAANEGRIGVHQDLTDAQARLREVLQHVFGGMVEREGATA
jgi:hypothetical protein